MTTKPKAELWGTFSVKDHIRRRPFVADVLLYDRLVIPRPTTSDEEKLLGVENQNVRWCVEGWMPGRLKRCLDILGDLAIDLPWGTQEQQDWRDLYHGPAGDDRIAAKRAAMVRCAGFEVEMAKSQHPDHAPYIVTGGLITAYVTGGLQNNVAQRLVALAKTPDVQIEPVVAYTSYNKFSRGQAIEQFHVGTARQELSPYALFGWEFFVPEDTDKSDYEILRQAVKIARESDFREVRQFFHGWLKQMHEGGVDPDTARKDMLKKLEEYRKIVRLSGFKTAIKYAAKVVSKLAPLAELYDKTTGVVAGVLGVGAELYVDELLSIKKPDAHLLPAAVVYDGRKFFGKRK